MTDILRANIRENAPRPGHGAEGENTKDTNPKDVAAALNGRVPIGLCPETVIIATAMAFLEGALKYGRYNWRIAGVSATVYYDAFNRHVKAWWNGEDIDPKSGLPHLWKALACLAILVDAGEVGKLNDDRPPRAPVGDMLERLQADVLRLRKELAEHKPRQFTIADTPV